MMQVRTDSGITTAKLGLNATLLSLSAIAGAAGLLAYGVAGRSAQLFGASVYRGASSRRSIALTFDDGPSEQSLELLEILERWRVRATFFQCGLNVLRHPKVACAIAAAGHEIGNHTYSHAHLCPRLSRSPNILVPATVSHEFTRAQETIKAVVGVTPKLLRAPYGLRWFGMRQMQRELNLLGVMWTVIGHDWEWPSHRIAQKVLEAASPGGIVCLHDGRDIQPNPNISATLKAVQTIIPALLDQGYRFETVSEILQPEPALLAARR